MKKVFKHLFLFAAIGLAGRTTAQAQLKRWVVPPNQVNFSTGSPVVSLLPSSLATDAYYNPAGSENEVSVASNSMYDASGNLLFFVTQDVNDPYTALKVFDKNGNVIKDANNNTQLKFDLAWTDGWGVYHSLPGHIFNSWAEEVIIIPVPGNCNQYYIVLGYLDENNLSGAIAYQPVYAKVDMSIGTNGQLAAASSTSNLFDLTTLPGVPAGSFKPYAPNHKYRFGMAASPYRPSTNDYFLYFWGEYSTSPGASFYQYSVDASGISFVSLRSPTISFVNHEFNNYYSETEMVRLPSGNYRIARVRENINIYYCDLDYTTGAIVSGTERMIAFPYGRSLEGLEFSPDGNVLYYSYHGSLEKIGYLNNLSSGGTPVPTDLSSQSIGFIEMGYDGNMYFSALPGDHLVSKTLPNSATGGTWNMSAATLGADFTGSYSRILPDQLDGNVYYTAGAPTISGNNFACSTTAETYTLSGAYDPAAYYTWTVTGGTPATYTGTGSTLAITWGSAGGTITVQAGCSAPATFTVNSCCRYTGTVPPGVSVVYLNNKTEASPVTYSGTSSIVVINGTYNIGNAVTYNNCPTYLAPNAQVNINSHGYLNLLNGTVWQAGCDAMWNGITEYFGGVTVDNSTIRDAKLAIDSKSGCPFTIQNGSKLNANYRNILVETYTVTTHGGSIKNSTISCLSGTTPANCLIAPYLGKRTYSAIELNDVTQLNVGLDAAGQTNTFNNMDKGIISTNSGLRLYNNTFTNITYTGSGLGRCVIANNLAAPSPEKATVIGGTANAYQKNTFTNSTFGIFVNYNQDISIVGNTFTNLGEAANVWYCKGADNQVDFNYNIVNDCSWGLHALYNEGSKTFNANNNVFNGTIVTPKPNSTGISSENTVLSATSAPAMNILSNTMTGVLTGIKATNFSSANIRLNNIYSLSDVGSATQANGILVSNCPTVDVETNVVQGQGAADWWQNGIRIESSTNAKVLYNSVENIGRGLFFGSICTGTETAKNHMLNNMDGFLINYGITGYQLGTSSACRATENKWEGSFTNHLYSYYSTGTSSHHYLMGSPAPTSTPGGSMWPLPMVSTYSPTTTPYNAISYSGCATPSGYRMAADPKLDQWMAIANDEITFPAFDESAKWMSRYALFNTAENDPSVATAAEIGTFITQLKKSNIGKIVQADHLLTAGNLDAASFEALMNSITPSNTVEQNLKTTLQLSFVTNMQTALNSSQIEQLKEIAKQCPYEGGPGVYNARVLLSAIEATVYTNACEFTAPAKMNAAGIASFAGSAAFTVIPNPNNGSFTLDLLNEEVKDVVVYDMLGKAVYAIKATAAQTLDIDISSLPKGMYVVKVSGNGTIQTKKVITQ